MVSPARSSAPVSGKASSSSSSARAVVDWPAPRLQVSISALARGTCIALPPEGTGGIRLGRNGERALGWLDDAFVALPPFVFQLDALDQHRVGVGVEVRLGLEFRYPGTEHLIGNGELAGLVIDFDDQVLTEVLERDFGAEPLTVIPDLVRPLLELLVVGDPALERDRLELGAAGAQARAALVATL